MTKALKKIDDSTIEATIELGTPELTSAVEKAESSLGRQITIEGFRPGKVPNDIIRKHLTPEQIREEALQIAVTTGLQEIALEEKLDILDQQNFTIKENTPEKLVFQVTLTLYPNVTLGSYTNIPVVKKSVAVSEEELNTVLNDIAASRKQGEVIPELNDDFAKSLGQFTSLQNLRDMVRTGLQQEKQDREQERVRMELLRTVVANSHVLAPQRMVDMHVDSMLANFDAELHARGLELGPYLAEIKKTQDQLRAEWRPKAEEQVNMQLVMHAIARTENIRVSDSEVQQALEQQLQQHLDNLQTIDIQQVRSRLYSFLLNNKIFAYIESHAIMSS